MAIVALQIDSLGDTFFPEYVMAASDPLGEPQIPEQTTQVVEADVGIRRAPRESSAEAACVGSCVYVSSVQPALVYRLRTFPSSCCFRMATRFVLATSSSKALSRKTTAQSPAGEI